VSPETVNLLLGLLNQVQIPASAENVVEQAQSVAKAREELSALLEDES
jgi:hypothetical protein